jgi:hypothetical protein
MLIIQHLCSISEQSSGSIELRPQPPLCSYLIHFPVAAIAASLRRKCQPVLDATPSFFLIIP